MNAFDSNADQDRIDDLRESVRLCGDPNQKARLQRELDALELRQAEIAKQRGQAQAAELAKIAEGERRMAASKARFQYKRGELEPGVKVTREEAEAHALSRLLLRSTIELARERIVADGQHPVHVKYRLRAFLDELRAASTPDLARYLDGLIAKGEVLGLDADESMLFEYTPPQPPPPAWPKPEPAYVELAKQVIAQVYGQRQSLTHIDPISGRVASMNGGNYGTPNSRERVASAIERGARLAWAPTEGRAVPPKLPQELGAEWQPTPAGDAYELVASASAEQAA